MEMQEISDPEQCKEERDDSLKKEQPEEGDLQSAETDDGESEFICGVHHKCGIGDQEREAKLNKTVNQRSYTEMSSSSSSSTEGNTQNLNGSLLKKKKIKRRRHKPLNSDVTILPGSNASEMSRDIEQAEQSSDSITTITTSSDEISQDLKDLAQKLRKKKKRRLHRPQFYFKHYFSFIARNPTKASVAPLFFMAFFFVFTVLFITLSDDIYPFTDELLLVL